jgi:nitrate/nitrite transporter NarK
MKSSPTQAHRGLTLLALIAAGEAVFFLPFLLARVFRPTVLEVFNLSNLELGTAYGAYGIVAMVAYFCGGPLADRFGARSMLVIALVTTAAGGAMLITIPTLSTLVLLYAYWGITTIALFWAPLIRATREWGGELSQGAAFGLLDGGRGLLAAVTGSIMVAVFATMLPIDPDAATLLQKTAALRRIILLLLSITAATAVLLWFVLPQQHGQPQPTRKARLNLRGIAHVMSMPSVWLQACIILCAYVGFRATDDFSLYANQVLGLNEIEAARLGTVSLWVRPFAAITAGLLADKVGTGRMTLLSFALIAVGSTVLASGMITQGLYMLFLLTVVCASLGIFSLRGLYFAIMKESRIPLAFTGSAVGFVSLIGYTPDVFMGPLMGWLLDRSPGAAGHQHVFWVVTGFALLGIVTSVLFQRVTRAKVN